MGAWPTSSLGLTVLFSYFLQKQTLTGSATTAIGRRGNAGKRHEEGGDPSTDYGGPVARRRRADDGEAEQTRRARRGREQDFAEISRRMYDEIRSSRDPRDHVEDG